MSWIIAWFVDNAVAANLLMGVLVVGGLLTLPALRQEEFPNIDTEAVRISVPYLGAAPEESEEGVCIRIEEALDGTEGIERIGSLSVEGACVMTVELVTGTDQNVALGEIQSRVEGIDSFPAETEKPVVSLITIRQGVLNVAVSGDTDERTLKTLAHQLRDEIVALEGVSQADVAYVRPDEISIEISEQALRRHGLTLQRVAEVIRESSVDMPGGSLETPGGEILLRSKGQAYRGLEFEQVVVLTRPDGTTVTLGEIGRVVDGFRDDDVRAFFDGQPAAVVRVSRVGDEDLIEIAEAVKPLVAEARQRMPDGVDLTVWLDRSDGLRQRINTLVTSAAGGLVLVLLMLTLFLRFRLAFWVAMGIPVALLGTLMLFPAFDLSISSLAVMAFILVLGIVVDDAIVVGERIHANARMGADARSAAITGTQEVSIPVIFGVLTTVAAFLPLILIPGRMGQFFSVLGFTVICALTLSIVESQLILPAHLAHWTKRAEPGDRHPFVARWNRFQERFATGLEHFAEHVYQPALDRVLEWRYLAISTGVGVLILACALVASGRVIFQFFPSIEGDHVYASLTMPQGTPLEVTLGAVEQIERGAERLREELDRDHGPGEGNTIQSVLSSVGAHLDRNGPPDISMRGGGADLGEVILELIPVSERDLGAREIASRWRELTGPIPDAVELSFESNSFSAGEPIAIQLAGRDVDELRSAAAALRDGLGGYDGVFDITDSFRTGKREIQLALRPEARTLGLTQRDLARQVREAFYGVEVQRIQRGSDDVRVMVRYPEDERRSLGDLEDMRIRTADGTEVPFASVARADLGRGYSTIRRADRKRVVNVTADVDRSVTTPEEVLSSVHATVLPAILDAHPGVAPSLEGEQRERSKALGGLLRGFALALLLIYALLAIPLRSYAQPLVIMSAIPFGIVGAIVGHFIMRWDLVFFSMLGIVALSGVVVNDSLVLVDFINRQLRTGLPLREAVRSAGAIRFRAILLTSVTTFMGLTPLLFNRNPQTFFIVPIAISLAFGVLFATVITLFLVPALFVIIEDLRQLVQGDAETSHEHAPVAARTARL